MKTGGEVRTQLKQVSFRHLKKQLEVGLRPRPHNCAFNRTIHHPNLIAGDKGPCGMCIHPDLEGERLCDTAWGGVEKAKECSLFQPTVAKDDIKSAFKEWLATAQLHEVAEKYPDMAALLWVLQAEAPNREVEIGGDEDWEPEDDAIEEEFMVEFAGMTLRFAKAEEAEAFNTELAGRHLALTTATTQLKSAATELEKERVASTQLKIDLEAKTNDHKHVSDQVSDLKREKTERAHLVVSPVSWWRRMFGGGS
jgi:hypothetical protein